MFDNNNKPQGIRRVYLAAQNSGRAIRWLASNEAAFRQELLLLAVSVPITLVFDVSFGERVVLVLAVLFILFTEIVNTAIEAVVDRVGLEIHPLSGLAKDLGSAAVLLSIVMAAGVWVAVLV